MDRSNAWTAALTALLTGWKLPAETAQTLAWVLTVGAVVYAAVSLLFLLGRATKKIKRSVSAVERLAETLAAVFLTADLTLLTLLALHWTEFTSYLTNSEFWVFHGQWWLDSGTYSDAFLTAALILAVAAVLLGLIPTAVKYIVNLVRDEIKDHGAFFGALLAVYDFFFGPFVLALLLTAWAFLQVLF